MVDQHMFLNSSSCFSQQSNRDNLSSCEISRVFLKIFIHLLTWLRQVLLAACGGLSCGMRSFSLVMAHRLSCPVACGILVPLTRDQTSILFIGRWVLNHWTTRGILRCHSVYIAPSIQYPSSFQASVFVRMSVCVHVCVSVSVCVCVCVCVCESVCKPWEEVEGPCLEP